MIVARRGLIRRVVARLRLGDDDDHQVSDRANSQLIAFDQGLESTGH